MLLALAAGRAGAGDDVEPAGYPPVLPGYQLAFPRDGGAHPDFRTEWWYVTGWLEDAEGAQRGFQITFFRVRTRIGEDNPSRFAPTQLILAHAAVADPAHGRLLAAERAARALSPLAGVEQGRTHAWVDGWSLAWGDGHYRAQAADGAFSFDLRLRPDGPPMLNGEDGFSRKDADPAHASHYYSRPQLVVSGTLEVGGRRVEVAGSAWLDHEWSSGLMPPGAHGWDWIGINLHDGGALMAFRMRAEDGRPLWAAGTLRGQDGAAQALDEQAVHFSPSRHWRSPRTGARYPVAWRLEVTDGREGRARAFEIVPLMDDQELDSRRSTGAVYWEGAVRLLEGGREIGRGYLEMTGYAGRLRM
ncbi:carotenoid 1,2-hydratase [Pseudothauera nasutitermitis]|uniref:Carotenoid 1,2-hydratase n=2 Tax=Pseudothauera nasutitermitis TaxID=2565930 RepID=A0A4S4B2C1_9RHOO|nr:lipocalin-like domain-containing protein [Pseudothauera nasutitermitis]THF66643.1 carotenoid 1,2-hydratase [Pseudothauera nasutitermitis]